MGVLGLAPFLQKTCPEVIKHLPDRLRSLTGKTIVIDGTLVTQRFHFAQAPHPYRHVLGWYRLIRELNDAGVSAICVFDGKERSLAKGLEIERRKEVRRLAVARGLLENDRLKRLRMLSDVLYKFRNLDIVARERATELLRQLHPNHDIPLSAVPKPTTSLPRNGDHLPEPISEITSDDEHEALFSLAEEDPSPLYTVPCAEQELMHGFPSSDDLSSVGVPTICDPSVAEDLASMDVTALAQSVEDNLSLSPDQELIEETEDVYANGVPVDLLIQEAEPSVQEISPLSMAQPDVDSGNGTLYNSDTGSQELEDVNATFTSLYLDFRRSISKLALLAARESSALSSSVLATPPSDLDTQAEIVMTKAQYQLTLDERSLWEQLVSSPAVVTQSSEDEPLAVEMTLGNLTQTSNVMFESYQRRTNPPTTQTYEDSKSIIQAMGVPCIDSVGPFEAEALASSIVLSGLADYVASEDTDVLVYDAPLIRNLTNRQSPLTVVSGVDIRMVLELDRASFIDFALLLGTDFSQRIRKVGPARALKFIKAHGSIERVVELETKYAPQIPQNVYLAQVEVARMVYQTLPPVPEKDFLQQGAVDETAIVKLLEQYKLGRALMSSDWDYGAALEGNYFQDDPCAS